MFHGLSQPIIRLILTKNYSLTFLRVLCLHLEINSVLLLIVLFLARSMANFSSRQRLQILEDRSSVFDLVRMDHLIESALFFCFKLHSDDRV